MKSQNGFSILEVLIAISLLSFITIGVVSLTNDATNTKDRISSEDKEKMQLITALNILEWDLSHLYTPLYFAKKMPIKGRITESIYNKIHDQYERNAHFSFADIEGRPVPSYDNPDKNTFEFFTTSNRRRNFGVKQSNFAWVKYVLEQENEPTEKDEQDQSGRYRLIRYFNAENPYKSEKLNTDQIKGQVILENLEEIEFSFWNGENKKFMAPLTQIPNGPNLIRAIKINLIWKDKLGGVIKLNKIYRPLFPLFNASEDPDDLEIAQTAQANSGQLNPNEGTTTPDQGQGQIQDPDLEGEE